MNDMKSDAKKTSGATYADAWRLIEEKNYEEAVQAFQSALNAEPAKEGYLGLGCAMAKLGEAQKAITALKAALRIDPAYVEAYRKLGDVYLDMRESVKALEYLSQAVAYDPSDIENIQALVDLTSKMVFENANPNFKGLLTACLESQDVNFRSFGATWYSILSHDKKFGPLLALAKKPPYEEFAQSLKASGKLAAAIDPFFLFGLGRFIVGIDHFERWITYLRLYMLEMHALGKPIFHDREDIEFLHCAVMRYAFFTDYIFDETEQEAVWLQPIKRTLESTDKPDLAALALYGCYRHLSTLSNAASIARNLPGGDHVSQIPKSQIEDYLLQQEIKKDIVAITKIQDDVSAAVREQYENYPYPRWDIPYKGIYNREIEGRFIGEKAKILIAGTGTGQEAIELAYAFPDAEILGVDLSRTSLAYGIMRARQLGINNLTFRQADINELGSIGQSFDYIASSGVLHHLKDPEAGWKVLHGLLNPGGLMRIALYSRIARVSVTQAWKVIAEKNLGNDTESIRAFRRNISDNLEPKYRTFFYKSFDYFSLPMCRDLIFHVQEHQFDLLQIKDILQRLNLKFLAFNQDDATLNLYKIFTNLQDDTLTNLDLWNNFEQAHPNSFAAMYSFWCEKAG